MSLCLYVCMSLCLYVFMSVCLYVCMSVCLFVYMSLKCLPVWHWYVCLSVHISMSIFLSLCQSVSLSVWHYVIMSQCLFVSLSVIWLLRYINPSLCLSFPHLPAYFFLYNLSLSLSFSFHPFLNLFVLFVCSLIFSCLVCSFSLSL